MTKAISLYEYYISEAFIGGIKTIKNNRKQPAFRKNVAFDISDAFLTIYTK